MHFDRLVLARAASAALVPLGLAIATEVHATGAIGRAHEILLEPGNPAHRIMRSDAWGLFRSTNGGETWQYVCAEAYGGNSLNTQRYSMLILPGGRLLVAAAFDGLFATDDGCTFRALEGPGDPYVGSVVLDPRDPSAVFVTSTQTSETTGESHVWRSTDGGESWAPFGGSFPTDFYARDFVPSPTDPPIWYASGGMIDGGLGVVVSKDEGATWRFAEIPATQPHQTLRLAQVHPRRPDVAFLWLDAVELVGAATQDEYWVTSDGGSSWSLLFAGAGDLPGFALSPDGEYVLISGPYDGIQEARFEEALSGGPSAFTRVMDGATWGLGWNGDVLLFGGNNFAPMAEPSFMLGSSTDRGRTFSVDATVCQIEFSSCEADSTVARLCTSIWTGGESRSGLESGFFEPRCSGAPPAGTDAGTPDGGEAEPAGNATPEDSEVSGFGCAIPRRAGSVSVTWALTVAALAAACAGRRKSRGPRRPD